MKIRKIVREIVEKQYINEIDFLKNIFRNKVEKKDDNELNSNLKIEKLSVDKYKINKNLINKLNIEDTGYSAYENFLNQIDNIPTLSWLLKGKFYAQYISINPKTQTVTSFIGEWYEGEFKGELYTLYSTIINVIPNQTGFEGGLFRGKKFNMSYQYWKTSPKNFISGIISNSEEGLLGLPNITSTEDASNKFHLIQVPVGYYINIKTEGDAHTYSIRVDKRLDKNNTDFIFTNINNNNKKIIPWSSIRQNFDKLYLFNGKKSLVIGELLKLKGPITSIKIESTFTADDLAKQQLSGMKKAKSDGISLNFSKIPDSKFSQLGSIKSKPNSSEAINYISSLRNDFENGGKQFLSNLTDIRTDLIHVGIQSTQIPDELRFVTKLISDINHNEMNEIRGKKPTYTSMDEKELPVDLINSMKYLENFYTYFIKYISNQAQQALLIDKIKAFLSNQFEAESKKIDKKSINTKDLGL